MPYPKKSSLFFTIPNFVPIVNDAWKINAEQNYLQQLKIFHEEYRNEKAEAQRLLKECKENLAIIEKRIEICRWVVLLNKVLDAKDGKLPEIDPEIPLTERHIKLFTIVSQDPTSRHRHVVENIKTQHLARISKTEMDMDSSIKKLNDYLEQSRMEKKTILDYERQIKHADNQIAELKSEIRDIELEIQLKIFFANQNHSSEKQRSNSFKQDCGKEEYFKSPQYK